MNIEIRTFSELEMSDRGIEGTDVACAVAVDGKVIGYTDDYGTFYAFKRDDLANVDSANVKDQVESLVQIAGNLWTETS